MRTKIAINEISVMNRAYACAHSCQYCLTGKKALSRVSFDRFAEVVESVLAWRDAERPDLKMICSTLYSAEHDLGTQVKFMALRERVERPATYLLMGGLAIRSEDEMRGWLEERQAIGIEGLIFSLGGTGAVHDRWNAREGDFAFLMRTLRTARELGFQLNERIFLTQDTLPSVEPLLDEFESIGGDVNERIVIPFLYRGQATHLENQRITEDTRDALPDRIRQHATWSLGPWEDWRSEREWVALVSEQDEAPRNVRLFIELNEKVMDQIGAVPIGDFIAGLYERTMSAYTALPSTRELCRRYGDRDGRKIYTNRDDIERKWFEQYLAETHDPLERQLTYLLVGS
jgi:hypothetical protein